MTNTPTIPTLPKELITTLFKQVSEFYELAPWEFFGDSEYFGVLIPETKDIHFVSIMGGGGQCFGLATYRGIRGLMFLQDLLSGEEIDDPFEVRLEQEGLLFEYTTKKYLDEEDLQLIKNSGHKPSNAKAWPLIRNMKPGYVPWFPTTEDIHTLIRVLSATTTLVELTDEDPDCLFKDDGKKFPIFVHYKKTNGWKLEFWGQRKIQSASIANENPYHLTPVNELLLQKAKNLSQSKNLNIELHDFFAREPVLEKDRPFYPRICSLFEKDSGTCLGMELISPEKDLSSEMRDLVLNRIVELGTVPKSITVTKPEHFIGAITLEKALDIEIKFGAPEHGLEFESGFRKKMEADLYMEE